MKGAQEHEGERTRGRWRAGHRLPDGSDKVGLTKKGKGTEWMLVVEGIGLPLGSHLDGAHRAEVRLAEQTLDTIRVARPWGVPSNAP